MSEKYIKRIKKGKGRKLKEIKKSIKKFAFDMNSNPEFYVKPIIPLVINLMIIGDLKEKEKEKEKEKMTDNEIMFFNEEIMAKINKRKIQPLEEEKENNGF